MDKLTYILLYMYSDSVIYVVCFHYKYFDFFQNNYNAIYFFVAWQTTILHLFILVGQANKIG